jgi:glycosyltransferase involved in cell wall biosynthesis
VDWTNVAYTLFHLTEVFDRRDEFDILHMHLNKSQDYLMLPLSSLSKTPVLFTLHFMLPSPNYNPDRFLVLDKYRQLPFTSLSNSQRNGFEGNFVSTVYNSIDINNFPYNDKPQAYLVWLGKVNPVKGTKEAILAAKQAGEKILVLGAVDKDVERMRRYYEEEVAPLIDGKDVIWIGEVGVKEKAELLGRAKAFLNPISWEEPFGLVMIESQAVGTPVISFRRGAAEELIIDGKTGFLVDNLEEMVEKIKIVDKIDRRECRRNVEERFTIEKMTDGYLEAYKKTIKNWDVYLHKQQEYLHERVNKP